MPNTPPNDSPKEGNNDGGGADATRGASRPPPCEPRLLDQIHTAIARLHYSSRTEEADRH